MELSLPQIAHYVRENTTLDDIDVYQVIRLKHDDRASDFLQFGDNGCDVLTPADRVERLVKNDNALSRFIAETFNSVFPGCLVISGRT